MKIRFYRRDKAYLQQRSKRESCGSLAVIGMAVLLLAAMMTFFSIQDLYDLKMEKLNRSGFILEKVTIGAGRRSHNLRISGTDVITRNWVEYKIGENILPKAVQWMKVDLDRQLEQYVSVHSHDGWAYGLSSGGVVCIDPEEGLRLNRKNNLELVYIGLASAAAGILCLLFAYGIIQIETKSGKIYPEESGKQNLTGKVQGKS